MVQKPTPNHIEWLSLIETSGPFLSVPVLDRAFPQGLDPDDPAHCRELGIAMQEFDDDEGLRRRWVRWVLENSLEYPDSTVKEAGEVPASLAHHVAEHGQTLRPDLAIANGEGPRVLVTVWPSEQGIAEPVSGDSWPAAPQERLAELLRANDIRLGLATNGREWTLVSAKTGESSGYATWDADLWLEDRITLRAFRTLLGVERTLGAPTGEALEDLLNESAEAQHEVTDQLGKQVRFAIELLISALDRADREQGGELLGEISNEELYLGAVTMMMRLVFLFTAEERGLFPLNDELYAESYAASTIRAQLQEEADRHSEEPLERRSSGWFRLLATFRAVHGGASHDQFLLPAYGGQLFDPDRFPFLEGRAPDSSWDQTAGSPLPIDDRTLLHILDALQMLRIPGKGAEAQRLSYRSLDVEQIGHVYEGLLDHTAIRTTGAALGFDGKLEPEIALGEVEGKRAEGEEEFCAWLAKETGRSASAIKKRLDQEPEAERHARLRAECEGDEELLARVLPYQALLRTDLRGYPTLFLAGGIYVTQALERRSSGTYYTTRSLAEEVVKHALDPIAYAPGPAEESDPEGWSLKSPAELLELKVCDMAMGSGAFLVAACRYLSRRILEAWEGLGEGTWTPEGEKASGKQREVILPDDREERLNLARRLVADRCLYGVDRNQMAVDMAKLSLWLITMARDRPFTFLDHALRAGDSLLGVTDLAQIKRMHIDPEQGAKLHGTPFDYRAACGDAIERALESRRELEAFTALDVADSERKAQLNRQASSALDDARLVGDLVVGAALCSAVDGGLDATLGLVAGGLEHLFEVETTERDRALAREDLGGKARQWLNAGRPPGPESPERHCFHWPLEFPEVFSFGGFDAVVGNPPFQGGKKISPALGRDFREYLVGHVADGRGNADLVAYFFLRSASVINKTGVAALLATNTIAQGETRVVGLDNLERQGVKAYRAVRSRPWPGEASVDVSELWLTRRPWQGSIYLDGEQVVGIRTDLTVQGRVSGNPQALEALANRAFVGCYVNGGGFALSPTDAEEMIGRDPSCTEVIRPYLGGRDLNASPDATASRFVIDFFDRDLEASKRFEAAFERVERLVLPHREGLSQIKKRARERWWRFEADALGLRSAMTDRKRVLAMSIVSRTIRPTFVSTDQIISHKVCVFDYDDWASFAFFNSSFHELWALARGSTLRSAPNYSPTDCFATLVQPARTQEMSDVGEELYRERWDLGHRRALGLTGIYKLVHDQDLHDADIQRLRTLHSQIDAAVSEAYGWEDLDLDLSHYETSLGSRFTLPPGSIAEILDRLLELNHERYNQEVAQGLHGKSAKPVPTEALAGMGADDAQGTLL